VGRMGDHRGSSGAAAAADNRKDGIKMINLAVKRKR
jgi:hypothetical protein